MSDSAKYRWVKIADSLEELHFNDNRLAQTEADGKKITIGSFENALFACANKCPHASGILADGYMDALGNIVCPLHRYKFSIKNGRNVSGEGYFLKTYPVEHREDGVFVGLEPKGLFNW